MRTRKQLLAQRTLKQKNTKRENNATFLRKWTKEIIQFKVMVTAYVTALIRIFKIKFTKIK